MVVATIITITSTITTQHTKLEVKLIIRQELLLAEFLGLSFVSESASLLTVQ